ncbi:MULTISPECIES: hypothetical protein [unclassified Burkholderia]|uniref:hypothetical protein n=1 Tax=unclassified Burkholderia TaxID=2613784 RepID=UPI000A4CE449|nr:MULTISPECIES: hypothetical protein [unclassified Burkholderia]
MHPNQVIQVLVGPSSVGVSSGNRAALQGKAVLRSVTLKRGSAELWVNLGEGRVSDSGSRPWNPATMQVAVTGLEREVRWPPVVFVIVDH